MVFGTATIWMRGNLMHFEILVEDQSGKKALDLLVPKILGDRHTCCIHSYKGIGRIPRNLGDKADASKRILLDQLPKLLRGYGNTFAGYPHDYPSAHFRAKAVQSKYWDSAVGRLFFTSSKRWEIRTSSSSAPASMMPLRIQEPAPMATSGF